MKSSRINGSGFEDEAVKVLEAINCLAAWRSRILHVKGRSECLFRDSQRVLGHSHLHLTRLQTVVHSQALVSKNIAAIANREVLRKSKFCLVSGTRPPLLDRIHNSLDTPSAVTFEVLAVRSVLKIIFMHR
jgi:hypothetical protein